MITTPTLDALDAGVRYMTRLGPRHSGNAAHRAFVSHIADGLRTEGIDITSDRQAFERWEATRFGLRLLGDDVAREVHTAAFYPYSGTTPEDGVRGKLASEEDLEGNIALIGVTASSAWEDITRRLPSDVAVGSTWSDLVVGTIGPRDIGVPLADRPILGLLVDPPDLANLRDAGAIGCIVVVHGISPENLAGTYVPFNVPAQGLPALYVDPDTGGRLRDHDGEVELTLTATVEAAETDQLIARLPGSGDEAIVVLTHTDGPNAFEENGAVAVLEMARHFNGSRRHRDLVFVFTTGHMSPGVRSADLFFTNHPEIVSRTVATVVIEHLGATEWSDGPAGYHATGHPEPAICFVSHHRGLQEQVITAFNAEDLESVVLLHPIGGTLMIGEGLVPNLLGIPTVGYVPGPHYLLSLAEDGHLSRFDPRRMEREVAALTRLVGELDAVPREALG